MASSLRRTDHALDIIEQVAGMDERDMVESRLATPFAKQALGDSLHIGGYRGGIGLFKTNAETYRRNLARAIVLTQLAFNRMLPAQSAQQLTALLQKPAGELEKQLCSLFPYKPFRGQFAKRSEWKPELFTTPSLHSEKSYMYLIHTIMGAPSKVADVMAGNVGEQAKFDELRKRYVGYASVDKTNPLKAKLMVRFHEEYLDNPNIIRQNIISSSVISQEKHATYYPFGFIMRVPPECIYITSPTDVGVANRTTNIVYELNQKKVGAIMEPRQVLANTNGLGGDTGYNEIVVVGTAPEGKQVDVIGLFVKTDGQGNIYMRPQKDTVEPYVNADIQARIAACARRFKLPVVPIVDTTSAPSVTAWPFGELDRVTEFVQPSVTTRTRRYSM